MRGATLHAQILGMSWRVSCGHGDGREDIAIADIGAPHSAMFPMAGDDPIPMAGDDPIPPDSRKAGDLSSMPREWTSAPEGEA